MSHPPSFRPPAEHPSTCRNCRGTGWAPGAPIPYTTDGETHEYTTVTPCVHIWHDDEREWTDRDT